MEVREDDPTHVAGVEAARSELSRQLVFGLELETRDPEEGVPALVIARTARSRGLARVEDA